MTPNPNKNTAALNPHRIKKEKPTPIGQVMSRYARL
jgi:hypothetical protein